MKYETGVVKTGVVSAAITNTFADVSVTGRLSCNPPFYSRFTRKKKLRPVL